jgi:hypothetical protein
MIQSFAEVAPPGTNPNAGLNHADTGHYACLHTGIALFNTNQVVARGKTQACWCRTSSIGPPASVTHRGLYTASLVFGLVARIMYQQAVNSLCSPQPTCKPPVATANVPPVQPRRPRSSCRLAARASGGLSYKDAGVDIDAGNELVNRIKKMNPSIGGFSGLVPFGKWHPRLVAYAASHPAGNGGPPFTYALTVTCILPGDSYLVAGTDGVGTKLKLAFDMNKHDTVGIDLVAMSVNDIITSGAAPMFFLDYFATGKLDVDQAEQARSMLRMGSCVGLMVHP